MKEMALEMKDRASGIASIVTGGLIGQRYALPSERHACMRDNEGKGGREEDKIER